MSKLSDSIPARRALAASDPSNSAQAVARFRIVLLLLVVVVLGRICTNDFTKWDDQGTLHGNVNLNPPTLASVGSYWLKMGAQAPMGLYIPFTYTIWGGLAWMGYLATPDNEGIHLNPYVFHGASVIVHAMSVLIVFQILRRLVRDNRAAFFGAVVFAIHPVQVETVAWTSGFKDLLCALLTFTAIWHFMIFRDRQDAVSADAQAPAPWTAYALATLAFVLAMLSKPTAMVLPAVMLAIDWLGAGRSFSSGLRRLAPWFVLSLGCAILAKWSQPTDGMPQLAAWTRPLVAADSLAFYAVKLVFPLTLVIDYARTPQWIFATRQIFYTPLLPLALGVLLWRARRVVPLLVAAAGVFVAGVSPVLGFVPFMFQFYTTVADHYLYIPMLGVALAVAWAIRRFPRPAVLRGAVVVLVLFGVRSFMQTGVWKDDFTLNLHTVTANPRSFVGSTNIVRHYLDFNVLNPNDKQSLRVAEFHATNAVTMRPEVAFAHDTLAQVYGQEGRVAEAMEQTKEYLRLSEANIGPRPMIRDTAPSHLALGLLHARRGEYPQAIEQFNIALDKRPNDPAILRALESVRQKMTTQPSK